MKLLDLYVARIFLKYFILVLMVPGTLFSLFELISQLDKAGKGTFTTLDAIYVVILTVPERFIDLIPIATFLGALSAIGKLSDRGELIAMEAAGRSVFGIAKGVTFAWFLITVVSLCAGEYAVPSLAQKAAAIRLKADSRKELTYTRGGFWAKRDYTFIHVGSMAKDGGAEHVSIYKFDSNGVLKTYITALSALLDKDYWLLQDVTVKKIKELESITRHLDKLKIASFLNEKDVKALELSPEDLSCLDLWSYTKALEKGGQNPDHFILALWRKLTKPLFALCLAILSTAFVYGSSSRATMGPRMASGLVAGLVFYFFDQITMQLGLLWGLNPVITAFIPVAASAIGAAMQVKKVI